METVVLLCEVSAELLCPVGETVKRQIYSANLLEICLINNKALKSGEDVPSDSCSGKDSSAFAV